MNKKFEDKKLINRIFIKLHPIPEFKNLSMDRKAEICISITKMIEGDDPYVNGFKDVSHDDGT